jgi:hypothetical protein
MNREAQAVSFISIEDEPPDLILSFAIWQAETDEIRSLILMRTPPYEVILDEPERGVMVSDENWEHDEDELLQKIEFAGETVSIETETHGWILDLRKVDPPEIKEAQQLLQRMNFDNRFNISIV